MTPVPGSHLPENREVFIAGFLISFFAYEGVDKAINPTEASQKGVFSLGITEVVASYLLQIGKKLVPDRLLSSNIDKSPLAMHATPTVL